MDKRATVIESIQKLLNLGVSDKEIIENLADVGIDEADALSLIREARQALMGVSASAASKDVSSKVVIQSKSITGDDAALSMNDQIVSQLPYEKKLSSQQVSGAAIANNGTGVKIQKEIQSTSAQKSSQNVSASANEEELEDLEDEALENDEIDVKNDSSQQGKQNVFTSNAQEKQKQPASSSSTSGFGNDSSLDSEIAALERKFSTQKTMPAQSISENKPSQIKTAAINQKEVPKLNPFVSTPPVNAQQISSSQKPPFQKIDYSKDSQKVNLDIGGDQDFDELWKKGIVVAVNAKLAEMKHIRDDVDSLLNQKVEDAMRKELYQYKTLIDSQKELIVSSNKEALDQKQKEIAFIIDAKIAELRQYNKMLGDNLASVESSKREQQTMLAEVAKALDDARRTKAQLVVEMNSELIKSKSNAQAFLDSSSAHLAQMDERINKALELEKNIAEGMLTQAEQRIEQLTIQRADELIAELQVELNRLQTASKKLSPELIDQKIAVLDEFKKQFLNSMQDSLNQINAAIEELNEKNAYAEQALQEKSLAIDAKLEELTKFEKEFTARLENQLNKK